MIPESLDGTMPESDEDEGRQKIWHGPIQSYIYKLHISFMIRG